MALAGRHFTAGAARYHSARAELDAQGILRIEDANGAVLSAVPLGEISVSSRLGNLPRRLTLPGGAVFECEDNEAVDALLASHHRGHESFLHRLERSWRLAATAVIVTVAAGLGFFFYGIPASAHFLAQRTPLAVDDFIGRESLRTLDAAFLEPATLDETEQAEIQQLFAPIAQAGQRGEGGYTLIVRASPLIGPNALALPDGTIVLTEELWHLRENDAEIQGVLAHEISHVDRRHSMQAVYQAALVTAVTAFVTGDATQIAEMATILPGILVQSAYTRELEQQADDDAIIILNRLGISPSHMADILERLEDEICGEGNCGPSWLGTHPETALRAPRLREAAPTP